MNKKKANTDLLLYDQFCPMCIWFARTVVKLNLMKQSGLISYQECIDSKIELPVDFNTAKNKIAFFISSEDRAVYGIDSLIQLIKPKFPMIAWLAGLPIIHECISILYQVISYNRNILAPAFVCQDKSCAPDENKMYRFLFVLFSLLLSLIMLKLSLILSGEEDAHQLKFLLIFIVFFIGQFAFQTFSLILFKDTDKYDYYGQLALVSLKSAGIMAILSFLFNAFGTHHPKPEIPFLSPWIIVSIFPTVVMHQMTMDKTGHHRALTFTWILYFAIAFKLFLLFN